MAPTVLFREKEQLLLQLLWHLETTLHKAYFEHEMQNKGDIEYDLIFIKQMFWCIKATKFLSNLKQTLSNKFRIMEQIRQKEFCWDLKPWFELQTWQLSFAWNVDTWNGTISAGSVQTRSEITSAKTMRAEQKITVKLAKIYQGIA